MMTDGSHAGEQADGTAVTNVEDGIVANDYKRSPKKTKKKVVKRSTSNADTLNRLEDSKTAVRLPALSSVGGEPRPARYINDAACDTLRSFRRKRGIRSRDYAIRCLALAQRFNKRPWLQQVRQAVTIATIGVKRVYGHQPYLFAGDNAVV